MEKFKFIPIINSVTDFSNLSWNIHEEHITQSLDDGLPYGYIDVNDPEGKFLAAFENLQIGADVVFDKVNTVDDKGGKEVKEKQKIKNWTILCIESMDESQKVANQRGNLTRVYFGHKLFLYKSIVNHAYPSMKPEQLVRRVLAQDQTRGFKCDVAEICKSDSEAITRYKTLGESEWEFLKNKVLPYMHKKKTPVYLWASLDGDFHLRALSDMEDRKCETLLAFEQPGDKEIGGNKALEEAYKKGGYKRMAYIVSDDYKVGNRKSLAETAITFSIERDSDSHFVCGVKTPTQHMPGGGKLNKVVPVDMNLAMGTLNGTSASQIMNRSASDGYAFVCSSQKHFIRTFQMDMTVDFCDDLLEIGMPVGVFINDSHWANGRWICMSSTLHIEQNGRVTQGITLVRPTFEGNPKEVKFAFPDVFMRLLGGDN